MEIDFYGLVLMYLFLVMMIVAVGYLAYKMAISENDDKTLEDYLEDIRESEVKIKAAQERLDKALERLYKAQGGKRVIMDPDLKKTLEKYDEALEKKRLSDIELQKALKKMNYSTLKNGREENAETD